MIEEGSLYRHYKGTLYYVHFVGTHTETLEELVTYQEAEISSDGRIYLNPDKTWYRPFDNFCSEVEVDGKLVPRFEQWSDRQ